MNSTQEIHHMTGSSTVKCGAPMRLGMQNPKGWDMSTASVEWYEVTCKRCLGKA